MAENSGLGGTGESGPRGESAQPAMIVGDNGGDTGLLAHELGNSDAVWGGVKAPRKRALVVAEPTIEERQSTMDFRIDEWMGGPRVQRHG
jgi:hypothetical protein